MGLTTLFTHSLSLSLLLPSLSLSQTVDGEGGWANDRSLSFSLCSRHPSRSASVLSFPLVLPLFSPSLSFSLSLQLWVWDDSDMDAVRQTGREVKKG